MTSLLVSTEGSSSTRSMMSEAAFAFLAEFDKEERREAALMSETSVSDLALAASATDCELTPGTFVVETRVRLTSFKDLATADDDEVMIMSDPRTVRELALELDGIKFTLSS